MAWWQLADGTDSFLPLPLMILVMATGAQYLPRAATVAYAAAIDSGETLTAPRVKDGMLSTESWLPSLLSSEVPSALVRPMAAAVRTTSHRPTFCLSMA